MSHSNDPGWSWFERTLNEDNDADLIDDIPARFARCFQGIDGEAALSHLAQLTMARPLAGNADIGVLRHLEGQRYLVSYIIGLVRQGRAGK
jgi:hypothetical protein